MKTKFWFHILLLLFTIAELILTIINVSTYNAENVERQLMLAYLMTGFSAIEFCVVMMVSFYYFYPKIPGLRNEDVEIVTEDEYEILTEEEK